MSRHRIRVTSTVVIAMLTLFGPLSETSAKLNQAVLSFTPSGDIKPRVASVVEPVNPDARYITGTRELREVLLPDGTVISLGRGTEVWVNDYAYTRNSGEGKVTLEVLAGVVRIVGGAINNRQPILVRTPSAEMRLLNAAVTVSVDPADGRTRASLLYGQSLSLTSGGQTETLVKPGFELVSTRSREAPEGPARQDGQVALADMAALETLQLSTLDDTGQAGGAGDGEGNSVERINALATEDQPGGEPVQSQDSDNTTSPPVSDPDPSPPLPNTDPPAAPDTVVAGTGSAGFGPGAGGDTSRVTNDLPSQANGDLRRLAQGNANAQVVTDNGSSTVSEPLRDRGQTAGRLYNASAPFTLTLSTSGGPTDYSDLSYVFVNDALDIGSTGSFPRESELEGDNHALSGGGSFDRSAPFILSGYDLPSSGQTSSQTIETFISEFFGDGQGSIFGVATHFESLQAGFAETTKQALSDFDTSVVERDPDNFLLVEVSPGRIDRRERDQLKDDFVIDQNRVEDPVGFVRRIGIPVRLEFSSIPLQSTQLVDIIATEVLTSIDDLGITAADVKPPNDPGYATYIAKIQPMLDDLTAIGGDPSNGIDPDIIVDVRRAFEGFEGTSSFIDPPSVDVDALQALNLDGMAVNDPIAFLDALGRNSFSFDLTTRDQVDDLATTIADPDVAVAAPLGDTDLAGFDFLDSSDRSTILFTVNQVLALSEDPTATERFLFATGDVDVRLAPEFVKQFSVDRFFISAGLENFNQKDEAGRSLTDGIRAFLREQTGLEMQLADTGLLVVNNGSGNPDAQNALLHADFGLEGIGSDQQSTISVTIGDVDYQVVTCAECGIQDSVEAVVSGETIGSSHGTITPVDADGNLGAAVDDATVAFASPLRSTAAGGGNPALNRDGYAGYFVLENYDPAPQGAGEAPLAGGTERPIGNPSALQNYAYLRLATATGSSLSGEVAVGDRSNLDLTGWLAGLAEREGGDDLQIVPLDTDASPDNFTLQTDATTNRVAVVVQLRGDEHSALTLGGLNGDASRGASAFVDDNGFAARTQSGGALDAALVSCELVRGGLPAEMQAVIPDYQYLKWGFFFGDTLNDSAAGKQMREHVHLATWVAGKVPQPSDLPTSGEVSYAGHAIGNVYSGGAGYTAVGSYQNTWNFADRRGTANLDFDRANYTGNTSVIDGAASFQGRLDGTALGPVDASNRIGGLRGSFVRGGDDPVAGVAGRFSIQETSGDTYRASGTFGAEKAAGP